MKRTLPLLLLFLFIAAPAEAVIHTRYVSNSGSNSNTCLQSESISTPKLTLTGASGAIACMGTSDILYIRAGTYNEMISTDVAAVPSGTAANEALIAGYPGDLPSKPLLQTTGQFGIQLNGTFGQVSYLTFQNLIIDGVNATNTLTSGDGIKLRSRTDHIRVIDSEIKRSYGQGIVVSNTPVAEALSVFNKFQKLSVHDNGDSQQYDHGIYILTADNTVEDCDIYANATYGVQLYHGDSTVLPARNIVRRNYIHNNARLASGGNGTRGGIIVGGPSNQIYQNVVQDNLEGIELGFGTVNSNLIYNNTIEGNTSYGLNIRSGMTGNVVRNNIFFSNGSNNFTDAGSGTTKTNNLCSASQAACQIVNATAPFVNAATNRFDLQAGSSAVDAGVDVGLPFNGTPDLGAYETFVFSGAVIANTAPYKTMVINFTSNVAPPLLPASGCTGFSATKNGSPNTPIVSCTVTGASQISLLLTDAYTSGDSATFTYTTVGAAPVTDSRLIGNLPAMTQRLNAISSTPAITTGLTGGGTVPVLTQAAFRFESFGGTEAAPDGMKTVNTNATIPPNQSFRVRIQVSNSVASFGSSGYTVYAQKNGLGGYVAIPNGPCTPAGICFVTGTGNLPPELLPNTPTTERLAGAGTFKAGGVMLAASEVPDIALAVGEDTELLLVLAVGSGNSSGDYFDLHIVRPGGIALDSYPQTPRIIIGGNRAQFGAP